MKSHIAGAVMAMALVSPSVGEARSTPHSPRPPDPPQYEVFRARCPDADRIEAEGGHAFTVKGCAYNDTRFERYGEIYIDPSVIWWLVPFIREHEIGHMYDTQVLTPGVRNRISRMFGWVVPWITERPGDAEGGEMFADLFADCRLGITDDGTKVRPSAYHQPMNPKRFREFCGIVYRAYAQKFPAPTAPLPPSDDTPHA